MMRSFPAVLACVILLPTPLRAAAPSFLPFQGVLSDSSDRSPLDGVYSVRFALYQDPSGDVLVWAETQDVDVQQGFFTAYLGAEEPLDLALFRDHPELFLGIAIEDDSEMELIPIGVSAYAGYAEHCGDAQTVGGKPASAFDMSPGTGLTVDPDTGEWGLDQLTIAEWTAETCFDTDAELRTALDDVYMPLDYTPNWGTIAEIPDGFADGLDDNTTYTAGEGLLLDQEQFSLAAPTGTSLGGVRSATCPPGETMVGVDAEGGIVCGADLVSPNQVAPGSFEPEVVVNEPGCFVLLVADETGIFWVADAEQDKLARANTNGSGITTLALVPPWPTSTIQIGVDDEFVYWSYRQVDGVPDGALMRVPKLGGAEELLASYPDGGFGFGIGGGRVYWGVPEGILVVTLETADTKLLPGVEGNVQTVVVDEVAAYYARDDPGSDQGVWTVPLDGGVPVKLFPKWNVELVSGSDKLYIGYSGDVFPIAKTDWTFDPVVRLPVGGGVLRMIHEHRLYFGNQLVGTIAADGVSPPHILSIVGATSAFATDGQSLFWCGAYKIHRASFPW